MITPHPARLVLAALASGAFFATPATGTEYHVSPTGADGNDGSSGAMFKALSKAAEIAQAGDVITVHAGIYWPVKLSLADAAQVQNLGEHTRGACAPHGCFATSPPVIAAWQSAGGEWEERW